MKKTFFLFVMLASASSAFAQGVIGFHMPVPPKSMFARHELTFKEPPPACFASRSTSPSSGMAAAVAVSGSIAVTLRMLDEAVAKPKTPIIITPPSSAGKVVLPPEPNTPGAPPVIVIPEDTGVTSVHVVEMEPVVKKPVPITIVPMDLVSVP